jgi:CheY-like chemotaxis protein
LAKVLLVADDDEAVREVVCLTLEHAGYDVVTADNGVGALGIVRSRAVDGLLTDVRMPRLTGFELADRVQLIRPELPRSFS